MTAYGYVRQSRSDDDAPSQSPMVQEERIRALAEAKGDKNIVIAQHDLNVSGGKAAEDRPGFAQILEAIRDGDCTAVYAYDLSRLFRNLKEQIEFFEMIKDRRIPVRFVEGDVGEVAGATGDLMREVLGAMNQWQRRITSEKIKASLARKRRDEGYRHGALPYGGRPGEDVGIVLEAFKEAGSYDGAARILNARPVPNRTTNGVWHGSTVRDIVRRANGEEIVKGQRGARTVQKTFRLGGLLACSVCSERGTKLTGSTGKNGEVRYYCHRAKVVPHGRGWISESVLLPLIEAEVEHAALFIKKATVGSAADEARARELDAEADRLTTMFQKGYIDEATLDARMAEVADARSKLSTRRAIRRVTVPPDIREDEPARVSTYLRRLFTRVVVDTDTKAPRGPAIRPIGLDFDWADPSMRVAVP